MSLTDARRFVQRMAEQDFQHAVEEAIAGKSGADAAAALTAFAGEQGLELAPEDLLTLRTGSAAAGELSEDDLEAVVGGAGRVDSGMMNTQSMQQALNQVMDSLSTIEKSAPTTKRSILRNRR